MSSKLKSSETHVVMLSDDLKKKKIGIVVSEWNKEITEKLLQGSLDYLKKAGIDEENIVTEWVPGTFELTLGAQYLNEYAAADAVICLGCIIKGETSHNHYLAESAAININLLSIRHNHPFSFGVLTVDTIEQGMDRAGGKAGNKGEEAAHAALYMLALKEKIKTGKSQSKGKIGFGFGAE